MREPVAVQLERIREAWAEFKREFFKALEEDFGMGRFLRWLCKVFTGAGVPKPGEPPRGARWRWDIFEQCWAPTGDRARDNFPRRD